VVDAVARIARAPRALRFMVRLVKGAYWDGEIKRAQEAGPGGYPVFTHKHHTDICLPGLRAGADRPCRRDLPAVRQPQRRHAWRPSCQMARAKPARASRCSACTAWARASTASAGRSSDVPLRVYAPVGEHRDLLAYLVRRLLENGANSSFVHQLADAAVAPCRAAGVARSRSTRAACSRCRWTCTARHARNSRAPTWPAPPTQRCAAAGRRQCGVPPVAEATPADVDAAMAAPAGGFGAWNARRWRSARPCCAAPPTPLEAQLPDFCGLLVQGSAQDAGDCVAEVREAVDFLRYYALQAEQAERPLRRAGHAGRASNGWRAAAGAACSSASRRGTSRWPSLPARWWPRWWPATAWPPSRPSRRPAVARASSRCCTTPACRRTRWRCCTAPARRWAPRWWRTARGRRVLHRQHPGGQAHPAQRWPRRARIVPLIAETGGLNAMVVDSTALPEQVVDAVVQSAFRSAGQRCSALRLLCLHERSPTP
jgi:RHH-type proline utilization regulon transcriptional repressor/proline dehydrogenase/delta 1-pyrroline-5-carboxylate dehydrogenase